MTTYYITPEHNTTHHITRQHITIITQDRSPDHPEYAECGTEDPGQRTDHEDEGKADNSEASREELGEESFLLGPRGNLDKYLGWALLLHLQLLSVGMIQVGGLVSRRSLDLLPLEAPQLSLVVALGVFPLPQFYFFRNARVISLIKLGATFYLDTVAGPFLSWLVTFFWSRYVTFMSRIIFTDQLTVAVLRLPHLVSFRLT